MANRPIKQGNQCNNKSHNNEQKTQKQEENPQHGASIFVK
jgi:hypothetical protein